MFSYKNVIRLAGVVFVLVANQNQAVAQNDNAYRNASNQYYWHNNTPAKGYWQQDVAYTIHARIDEEENSIAADESLDYFNNSPDTLTFVYFHLYQNAFVKGSYLHHLEQMNKYPTKLGAKEGAGLGNVVSNVQVDGVNCPTTLDNTILKVALPKPLLPNGKIKIALNFKTYYDEGNTRRRMKMYDAWGFKHYNGCQWFPKLAVYDKMHGWDTYQHLNREFYGDFGVYDVTLDFPSNYVVEASGILQNESEVLPDELKKKLDIANFAGKKWDETPSIITPYVKGQRKQWRFVANNVHDFAFTADPSYRIQSKDWNGIKCVAIVQEPHAARWQNAADYVSKVIKTFSEEIGMYRYPKMVAADAADGMEYPMITLDGGGDPDYRGLFVHEIGHNWFYGQVGSNETYRAAMDEGFTQFLTILGLSKIEGETTIAHSKDWPHRWSDEPQYVMDRNALNRYTSTALRGDDMQINTHSDDFNNSLNHGGGYGLVYFKTASMLYNLQYVLGDSLFKSAMHHYFEQWKFAHPYFEDFRASMIEYTHVDLSWFFDQWFETTKTLDYGITKIKNIRGTDSTLISFKRKSDMQMPIDFTVTAKDGKKYNYHIPNTWFVKQTDATVLPKWYGWSKMEDKYDAHISVPGGVKSVQIDTTYRMADIHLTDNNVTKTPFFLKRAVKIDPDLGVSHPSDRRFYRIYYRPDLWWNAIDGIKLGVRLEGDYLNSVGKFDFTHWLNTHAAQSMQDYHPVPQKNANLTDYSFNFSTALGRRLPKLQIVAHSRHLEGLNYHQLGFYWQVNDNNNLSSSFTTMWRKDDTAAVYLTNINDWSSYNNMRNNYLSLAWNHTYNYVKGAGRYTLSARTPFLASGPTPFDYSYLQFECVNLNNLGKLEVKTRLFGRYGLGNQLPYESLLYLAGGSPEDAMDNKYTRSVGYVPESENNISTYDTKHYQVGGGLNLRGFAGYNAPDERLGKTMTAYKGRSGASFNIEVGFDNYFNLKPKFTRNWLKVNLYAFSDLGLMELSNFHAANYYYILPSTMYSDIRVDAGLGTAFTIKKWGHFDKAKPLTIRVDFPFFLNRAPYGNPEYATFRYVVGVNRAF